MVIGYLRMQGAAHAQVVDFYHASEYLHETVDLCRDRTAAERTKWYEDLRHRLRRDPAGVDKVIAALHAEARGRRAKKMKDRIAYFERHRERMRYVALDRRRLPVGTGPVESAIRRVKRTRHSLTHGK